MNNKMQEFRDKFFQLVVEAERVLITSHISPDEDSFSSVLFVYHMLTVKFPEKNIRMAYTGEPVPRFSSFKNYDKIEFLLDVADVSSESDLLIMLDGGQYSRFSRKPEILKQVSKSITIDHHASALDDFMLCFVDTKATSNAELLYSIFSGDVAIQKENAEYILLGILGDTGNLLFVKPEQMQVFDIVKRLLLIADTSIEMFQSRYRSISLREFELMKILIKNTTFADISGWPAVHYTFIEKQEAEKYTDVEVSSATAMYVARYLRIIGQYSWGFAVTPRTSGDFHASFRSLPGSVNVRKMAEQMGVGGGHDRAAGSSFKEVDGYGSASAVIEKILDWMKENKPVLDSQDQILNFFNY